MKRNPSLLEGLLIALLAGLLVTGAILIAGYENLFTSSGQVEATSLPVQGETIELVEASLEAISVTPSVIPSPTLCPVPPYWEPYEIKMGDSLEALAGERLAQLVDVMAANCLDRPGALPGAIIYLPPLPPTLTPTITSTPTITFTPTTTLPPCDYPEGWIRYSLKPGDTLFKLGVMFRTSEVEILTANCLAFGKALHAGDILLVPPLPTSTPTPK